MSSEKSGREGNAGKKKDKRCNRRKRQVVTRTGVLHMPGMKQSVKKRNMEQANHTTIMMEEEAPFKCKRARMCEN